MTLDLGMRGSLGVLGAVAAAALRGAVMMLGWGAALALGRLLLEAGARAAWQRRARLADTAVRAEVAAGIVAVEEFLAGLNPSR